MLEWTKIFDSITRVTVKSIIDPLFKCSLIFVALAIISAACKVETWLTITIMIFGGSCLAIALCFFGYHSVKNPDHLRSESYQLKKRSIDLLGDKDSVRGQITDVMILGPDEALGQKKI
jgi:hypothetical protein